MQVIKKLLVAKGVHYLVTRFGPRALRSLAFDGKYQGGGWAGHVDGKGLLPEVIAKYLRGGDLLIMGCGGASVLDGLQASGFKSALGIDLSPEAIRLASRAASDRVRFQVSDMETFQPPISYDVILFSESLYYVSGPRQTALLQRLSASLKRGGAFVVTLAEASRYESILALIRRNFLVREDCQFPGSIRQLIVFSPRSPSSEPIQPVPKTAN